VGCGGARGALAAQVGQLEVGAAGVPARLRPLGFTVAEEQQPVLKDTHRNRFCPTLGREMRSRARMKA
jgi:hypothetical protein